MSTPLFRGLAHVGNPGCSNTDWGGGRIVWSKIVIGHLISIRSKFTLIAKVEKRPRRLTVLIERIDVLPNDHCVAVYYPRMNVQLIALLRFVMLSFLTFDLI